MRSPPNRFYISLWYVHSVCAYVRSLLINVQSNHFSGLRSENESFVRFTEQTDGERDDTTYNVIIFIYVSGGNRFPNTSEV